MANFITFIKYLLLPKTVLYRRESNRSKINWRSDWSYKDQIL